ncbi:MAG: DUF1460 domain-containing protein [Paludibacter sp.]|nr:DUF1460 domain-containing protein [Paludibacter sp.]
MKQSFLLFIFIAFLLSFSSGTKAQHSRTDVAFDKKDSLIVENILGALKNKTTLSTGDLIITAGKMLIETPYVAHTLEGEAEEKLIVNLRALDCTTFAENCLALARTARSATPGFDTFMNELRNIRYRNGKLTNYSSRLHYFSDWIYNNEQKRIVKNISCELDAVNTNFSVDFMSKHSEKYSQLKNNPTFVEAIAAQEVEISQRKQCFVPEDKIAAVEDQLKDGDILGITTNIQGMDIQHVVMALRQNGRIHMLHASQKYMKVLVSDETLEDYLKAAKSATGIVVARPY